MLNKTTLFLILILLASCKVRRERSTPTAPTKLSSSSSKAAQLNAIQAAQIDFNTASIKAKANLNIDNSDHDVTMNIRIQKDKLIWVSITAFVGLEVARVLITPDSIKVLNRLENTYMCKPFSYIYEYTNKEITFPFLQSILVGNIAPMLINDSTQIITDSSSLSLKSTLGTLVSTIQINQWNKPSQTSLNDQTSDQNLLVDYANFTSIAGGQMPQQVTMQSRVSNKLMQVYLAYVKISINENLDYPFTVPKRFLLQN